MRPYACPLALAPILLLAATLATAAEAIGIVESRTFAPADLPQAANTSLDLKVHAYTFRGTRWLPDEIVDAVGTSAQLLAQCQRVRTRGEANALLRRR